MQIPILKGIYTDPSAKLRTSYPRNFTPITKSSGINEGYLKPADGFAVGGVGPGVCRGGVNWKGICYRVMGTKLIRQNVDYSYTVLGDVGGTGQVSFTYGFDRLAVCSSGKLFYLDTGGIFTEVTDPDLGTVLDVVWIDGYYMTTDGENLVVTELNDPTQVDPLKYGSSEADPDPIVSLRKIRNEIWAVNRYTIEIFQDVGGIGFPFSRVIGAQIMKGAVGTYACCVYMDTLAFLGGGRNEPPSVYMGTNGNAIRIATQEIETILMGYTDEELAGVLMEKRIDSGNIMLLIHLPDRTLCYDSAATQELGTHVWSILDSGIDTPSQYRAKDFIWCYDKWLVGDPLSGNIGAMTDAISTHWGEKIGWEFGTQMVYNGGAGFITNQLEIVAVPGRVGLGLEPKISTSYTIDGVTWSQYRFINAGSQGDRLKRLVWRSLGRSRNWRGYRFRGTSDAHPSCIRLEAQIEPLRW